MEINVIENTKDKLKIEIDNLTLVNLLNENVWKQGGIEFAAYFRKHIGMSKPTIIVRAKEPKEKLVKAAEMIEKDCDDLIAKLKTSGSK